MSVGGGNGGSVTAGRDSCHARDRTSSQHFNICKHDPLNIFNKTSGYFPAIFMAKKDF